jgi:hypothetical protein
MKMISGGGQITFASRMSDLIRQLTCEINKPTRLDNNNHGRPRLPHTKNVPMGRTYTPLTPTKRRVVCVLRDEKHLSFPQIGAKVGCDESTARRNYAKYHESEDWYNVEPGRG